MFIFYKPLSNFFYPLLLSYLASFCLFSTIEAKKHGGITLDLIHRDSPQSPSYNVSETYFERLNKAFHRSISRKSSISLLSSKSTNSISTRVTADGGEYLMKIRIGTPPVEILAIADTGSDLTWTQCKPCSRCYNQTAPLFDPEKTKTYRKVSCNSKQCSDVGSCDSSNNCKYQVNYGDKSYSIGDLAVDTFTFDSNDRKKVSFPKVAFGCGHQNGGTFKDTGSGIVGLGGGSSSIVKQLDKYIGGRFSYCLTFIDSNASSRISFGREAIVRGRKVKSTPIVSKYPDTFYFLTLEGVSVGSERLEYNSINSNSNSNFNSKESVEEGNIIIDSGTTLTFLPGDFYYKLESTLVKAIRGKRITDSQANLGLCYALPMNGKFNAPPIVAHFRGADVELRQESTFIEVEKGVFCLTLVPSQDLAIFGNLHQMNYHIGYDLRNLKVSFLPVDCSKTSR